MAIAFKTSTLEIPRGRKRAPIPAYLLKALDDALKSGKNLEATAPHAEINEARAAINRHRKTVSQTLTISVSVAEVDETTSRLLVSVKEVGK